jgi:hypothetical protein
MLDKSAKCPVCGEDNKPSKSFGMWDGYKPHGTKAGGPVLSAICSKCGKRLMARPDVLDKDFAWEEEPKTQLTFLINNYLMPKLETGQRSVIFAETQTGILLTPEGQRHIGQGEFYKVFNSEDEATAFAEAYVAKHPAIECSIRDENGEHLKLFRK